MDDMTKKIEFKVGDEVTSFLKHSSLGKIPVRGKIKEVIGKYGRKTYVISGGIVADYPTRTVRKIK